MIHPTSRWRNGFLVIMSPAGLEVSGAPRAFRRVKRRWSEVSRPA